MRSDTGFTVAELLVSVSLLMIVLTMVYFTVEAVEVSGRVTDRQSQFALNVTTPLHAMDKVLSQNKAIENGSGFTSDSYTLTLRSPVQPGTTTYTRHVYSAGTDGQLIERVYRGTLGSTSTTLIRTKVWSKTNANRSKGAMFTYLGPDGSTSAPTDARSVIVNVWAGKDGQFYSGRRQVYFRNR
jgi:hypothetical protein